MIKVDGKEELIALYEKHQSLQFVANEFGYTKEGMRQVFKRLGIAVNKPVRYSFDERFFSHDTEQVFYWAGFIAADGCLMKHGKSDKLNISLSSKDELHLELFKTNIQATHPIHRCTVKNSNHNPEWKDSEKSEISLLSKYFPTDLGRFNIVPRKTHGYTFPEWLINHPMVHHFMRGYFDGDGSWYIGSSKKTEQVFFSLRGTTKFLEVYRSILEENCDIPKREKPIRINNGIGVLEYGGNGVSAKIRDFLYRDASVYLGRKFDIVKDTIVVERLSITPEFLIQKMSELGEQKKIAAELGCSSPSISRYVDIFGIQKQMMDAKKLYNTKISSYVQKRASGV